MNCDRCDKEATVHETRVVNGQRVEKHLCEACAQEDGVSPPVPGQVFVQQIIKKVMPAAGAGRTSATRACETCGMTFAEFGKTRLLGCAQCYETFEAQFRLLLEREHEGATHHVGKVPRRALASSRSGRGGSSDVMGDHDEQLARISALRRQLDEAVKSEQYERAAKLRDEIDRLTSMLLSEHGEEHGEEEVSDADTTS